MQQFEIKIFANPSGYGELKLNSTENLFTPEIIKKRNFDGDYGTFQEGTFSVLFTPKAFIMDYIFNVVADAAFRDPQTHIAIAIERGYKLRDAYGVFMKLRKEFNSIAAEFKTNTGRYLASRSENFNNIVKDNIELAPDQFWISADEIDVTQRALVAYKTEEQLKSLLEEPNRMKFKSISLVYFLEHRCAQEIFPRVKDKYKAIPMSDEDFNSQVEVEFPDGHCITIKSRTDEIDYTCAKPYYKSERFCGRLNDHMLDWKVTQSNDRTKFFIGKELEPETKELKILCYDSKSGKQVKTPPSLTFGIGKFSDTSKSILKLTGEEIGAWGQDFRYECGDPSIEMRPLPHQSSEDSISFGITALFCYSVAQLFPNVQQHTGETVSEIKIYPKGKKTPLCTLSRKKPCYYDKRSPTEVEYEIPETKKYGAVRAGFSNQCTPMLPQFTKKDTITLRMVIKNRSIVHNLNKNKKPVYCHYKTAHDEAWQKKKFDEEGQLMLKEVPLGTFSYKIEINGYKPQNGSPGITSDKGKDQRLPLNFEETAWRKTCRIGGKPALYATFLLIGFGGGFWASYHQDVDNSEKRLDETIMKKAAVDSLFSRIHTLEVENNRLDSINHALKGAAKEATEITGAQPKKPEKPEMEQRHPTLIKTILQLPVKDKPSIKQEGSYVYNKYYSKLSNKEKEELEQVFRHPAWNTKIVPTNYETIQKAMNYLNNEITG